MKRRVQMVLAAGVVGLGFAVLGIMWWATAPRTHHITDETVRRVRVGQTEADLEALFGVPAGNYSRGQRPTVYSWDAQDDGEPTQSVDVKTGRGLTPTDGKEWAGEHSCVFVRFDDRGSVVRVRVGGTAVRPDTLLDKVRCKLGL